jgi:hypothetical protein
MKARRIANERDWCFEAVFTRRSAFHEAVRVCAPVVMQGAAQALYVVGMAALYSSGRR